MAILCTCDSWCGVTRYLSTAPSCEHIHTTGVIFCNFANILFSFINMK